jgi:hypothetical protein
MRENLSWRSSVFVAARFIQEHDCSIAPATPPLNDPESGCLIRVARFAKE